MKKSIIILLFSALVFSCEDSRYGTVENKDLNQTTDSEVTDALTPAQINAEIYKSLKTHGDFNWNDASDLMVWSALVHSDNILTVGYANVQGDDVKGAGFIQVKDQILNTVIENESSKGSLKSSKDVLIYDDGQLVLVDVLVSNMETIKQLRKLENIRYIEPAGYSMFLDSDESSLKSSGSSGCGTSSSTLNPSDYVTVSPGCKVPWNFYEHNIPSAWEYSTGSGVTIGLIDSGVSPHQSLLGSNFNNGYSSNRTINKYGVYVDSWNPFSTTTDGVDDDCGHGTKMASAMAAPRNDKSLPVGVAYNANLIVYRATSDVFLDGYHEQKGVAKALTDLGDTPSVKIITMAIGHLITINKIEDAVKYAYEKGKLIFAAGGTSTWFTSDLVDVIFPAKMSEVVAVTGITDSNYYTQCDDCHTGDEIEFTAVMQRNSDAERNTPVVTFYENTNTYFGGSSVSTAITSGIAALVWAKNPSWTREQVLQKLKESAELYSNKNSDYGYGCIDALQAVR